MKAATYERYGPPEVVSLREIPRPSPKHDEVVIRVHASTVTSGDWRARSLEMPLGFGTMGRLFFGIRKPRQPILGTELSGRIEEVGRDVTKFHVGDEVFAFTGAAMGCHAEFKCMSQDGPLTFKPRNLTHAQAAALSFGGSTSLSFLKRGRLQRGERVLVNGASGGVGSAAVQLAKHLGANVTGLCSTANVDLVRSLGADHVIDYTKEDFTRNGTKYDVIVDTAGTAPFSRSKDSLGRDGRLLVVLGGLAGLVQAPWVSMTSHQRIVAGPVSTVGAADLRHLAELAEAGTFKPVIDRSYSFDRIVDAHRYVDSGRKRGSVVIEMGVL